ncbi:Reticulon-like protein B13 [Forsythia ovata]|uniref:Reticulon-like protein n=1 Tax=Forsythia ovata TaxID=205694 RepID=A0ABD1UCZ4_9LAMI
MLWRNKRLNFLVLLVATAIWLVIEIYGFNFITVASWVAMAIVSFMFVWGNIHRLVGKEAPDLSGMEISEQSAMESAKLFREEVEKIVLFIFHVGAEKEWYVFAGVVACLYALSLLANSINLLTLCYIGVVVGSTVPVIYVKYEHKIRGHGERLKMKLQRLYVKIEEVMQKMKKKKKIAGEHKDMKEKKME